jgi:PAS domain S-box-containing protein
VRRQLGSDGLGVGNTVDRANSEGSPEIRSLSLLLVEDDPDDAELCLRALQKANLEVRSDVVATREEFVHRLRSTVYDVILTDYALGPWTGMDVLHLLLDEKRDTPLILVTGALGEERAAECIREGIADYILKDRLERLPIAIVRALENKRLRNDRKQAESLLRDSEAKFRTLAEATPAATFIEQGTRCCYVNRAAEDITGYNREDLLKMNFWELLHPESRKTAIDHASKRSHDETGTPDRHHMKILTKNGDVRLLDVTITVFELNGGIAALFTAFDVMEPKYVAEKLLDSPTAATGSRRSMQS